MGRRQPDRRASASDAANAPAHRGLAAQTRSVRDTVRPAAALCVVAMAGIALAAPSLARHAVVATYQHSDAVTDRLQWVSSGVNAGGIALVAGIIGELVGTFVVIMVVVGWADRR